MRIWNPPKIPRHATRVERSCVCTKWRTVTPFCGRSRRRDYDMSHVDELSRSRRPAKTLWCADSYLQLIWLYEWIVSSLRSMEARETVEHRLDARRGSQLPRRGALVCSFVYSDVRPFAYPPPAPWGLVRFHRLAKLELKHAVVRGREKGRPSTLASRISPVPLSEPHRPLGLVRPLYNMSEPKAVRNLDQLWISKFVPTWNESVLGEPMLSTCTIKERAGFPVS